MKKSTKRKMYSVVTAIVVILMLIGLTFMAMELWSPCKPSKGFKVEKKTEQTIDEEEVKNPELEEQEEEQETEETQENEAETEEENGED